MKIGARIEKLIAFIPLRGGSKSIPHKNIAPLGGKPLACWVIEAALGCIEIERVYVSTDDNLVGSVAEAFRSDRVKVVSRSTETATDTASTESAMIEFARENEFEHMILIQATSPLLTSEDLTGGIAQFRSTNADALLSVVRQKRFVWQERGDGFVMPWNYDPMKRPRRQEFPGFLVENGAFYICSRRVLLESGSRIAGRITAYVMPEETYFELDEPGDWIVVEELIKNRAKV